MAGGRLKSTSWSNFLKRKFLGQHFLKNARLLQFIADQAQVQGKSVIEIGAGEGNLTRFLAKQAQRVLALEKDRRFSCFHEKMHLPQVEWIYQDALKVPWETFLGKEKWVVTGNLPFYITSPLLIQLLPYFDRLERLLFLVQKEVAFRLAAPPGTSCFGFLSVVLQSRAEAKVLKVVSKKNFVPPPSVDAALLLLTPHREGFWDEAFFQFVKAGFRHRRKKLLYFFRMEKCELSSLKKWQNLRPQDLSASAWYELYCVAKKR